MKYVRIKKNICGVPGCTELTHIRGLCNYHYFRNIRTSEFEQFTTSVRHNKSSSPEYIAYMNMIQRCMNKNLPIYKYYGARGITVCERWLESFGNFLDDMGVKPDPSLSLDRVDNNGNYEPSNCRWTDRTTQNRNRR